MPTVIVTAQKEPEDGQKLPVSVTAVPNDTITNDGIAIISDAAIYAPNTYFSEFSARKLSFPRFRGISSGPGNPAITTYIDGVPQLHTNASSVDLLDVEQIELVRGPQSALFGRNALGGLINIASVRPSLTKWTGTIVAPFGNFSSKEVRGSVSGPLAKRLAIGVAAGRSDRDGFTKNDVTGNTIDDRSAVLSKVQVLWIPADNGEARAIVRGERARDGDYALNDLGALRRNPFHAARDFEGRTDRDVTSATVLARRVGPRVVSEFLRRVAAGLGRVSPRAGPHGLCLGRPWIHGGWFQFGVARLQGGVWRRARLARRGWNEDVVGWRQGDR